MAVTTLTAATLFDGSGTEPIRDAFIQIEGGSIKARQHAVRYCFPEEPIRIG